nr:redoxin domain-containing protein [Methylorubrum extorquens]
MPARLHGDSDQCGIVHGAGLSAILSFQDQKGVIAAMGAEVVGLSTQAPEYQKELLDRLGLSFPILSDAGSR